MATLFGNLFSWIGNSVSNRMRRMASTFIGGHPLVYPDMNSQNAITKGYEGNWAVYTVVKKDAKKFAYVPRFVYNVNADGVKEKIKGNDALTKLLMRPNEYQGQDAFFEAVRGFYLITGEAFIWLNRGNTDKVVDGQLVPRSDDEIKKLPVLEMLVMPSNHVYIVPDPLDVFGILGYEFEINGKRLPISKVNVIHWRSTNMCFDGLDRRHLRGMSPLVPGKKILQQNNDATDSAVRMFQNDGARGLIFNETFDDLTPKQRSDIEDVVDRKVNNNDIKGAIATVQGKWGHINFGGTAVDMQLIEAIGLSFRQICAIFDVPYEFYGDTTYENKEKAMKGWVEHSIVPACYQLDGELNRILIPTFNMGNAVICSDYTQLPEMQKDMNKLAEWLMKTWPIVPNEVREALGYEKYNDSKFDEPWVPVGIVPLSESSIDDGGDELVNEYSNETE